MQRIGKVQQLVKENNLSALIVDHPIDLYYLTGQDLSLGRLVVEEKNATLFVDGRYFEGCKNLSSVDVRLMVKDDKESTFAKWWKFAGKRVGFDEEFTTYAEFRNLLLLNSELVPLKSPIKRLREIKEKGEIDKLKKAAELGSKGFDYICTLLKEGVTEKEIAVELELFWLKQGGEKLAFAPHIAFGEGTSQPHYPISDRPLKKGELVLIDIGVVLDHYHSDMTRVLFYGHPPLQLQEIYQIVYASHREAVNLCRPGVKIAQVDRAARGLIEERGFKENFPHGLGHGVGLEIHESPTLRSIGIDAERPLKEGMVVTIEPGIYLSGIGGIRLEDTFVLTEKGCENITNRPLTPTLPTI
jgi:Xaa-Pro aminopeptidase